MEILLGPKQRSGEKVIIEALVKEFNPSARIIESELEGLVQ